MTKLGGSRQNIRIRICNPGIDTVLVNDFGDSYRSIGGYIWTTPSSSVLSRTVHKLSGNQTLGKFQLSRENSSNRGKILATVGKFSRPWENSSDDRGKTLVNIGSPSEHVKNCDRGNYHLPEYIFVVWRKL